MKITIHPPTQKDLKSSCSEICFRLDSLSDPVSWQSGFSDFQNMLPFTKSPPSNQLGKNYVSLLDKDKHLPSHWPVSTKVLLITTSISIAPSSTANLISSNRVFKWVCAAGKPVATSRKRRKKAKKEFQFISISTKNFRQKYQHSETKVFMTLKNNMNILTSVKKQDAISRSTGVRTNVSIISSRRPEIQLLQRSSWGCSE